MAQRYVHRRTRRADTCGERGFDQALAAREIVMPHERDDLARNACLQWRQWRLNHASLPQAIRHRQSVELRCIEPAVQPAHFAAEHIIELPRVLRRMPCAAFDDL